ncbi:MAG: YraN family protein [bacterium]
MLSYHKRRTIGNTGERAAARYLRDRGFLILHTNYRCYAGEIDIIARKLNLLVFAEVKTRSSADFAAPEESVTYSKEKKITNTASHYIDKYKLHNLECRFDIFSVYVNEKGRVTKVEHLPDAFDEPSVSF